MADLFRCQRSGAGDQVSGFRSLRSEIRKDKTYALRAGCLFCYRFASQTFSEPSLRCQFGTLKNLRPFFTHNASKVKNCDLKESNFSLHSFNIKSGGNLSIFCLKESWEFLDNFYLIPIRFGREYFFQFVNQRRKIIYYCIPKDVQINSIITVNKPVAHLNDLKPGNRRVIFSALSSNSSGCFTNNLHQANQSKLQHSIVV
jgi:hypothetical protein